MYICLYHHHFCPISSNGRKKFGSPPKLNSQGYFAYNEELCGLCSPSDDARMVNCRQDYDGLCMHLGWDTENVYRILVEKCCGKCPLRRLGKK